MISMLCKHHDFVAIQETHGTPGKAIGLSPIRDCTVFWSHYSRRQAGIALIVHNSFLSRFTHHTWIEIEQGYTSVLRLSGPLGSLDLFAVHLPLDGHQHRSRAIHLLSQHV